MSDPRFTPEEFARWMALPEDDPERIALARSAGFEARARMHDAFVRARLETPEDGGAEARAVLAERLARSLDLPAVAAASTGAPRPSAPRANRAAPAAAERGGWLERIARALGSPAFRPAYALAALVLVAGITWFSVVRDRDTGAVRGGAPAEAFAITDVKKVGDGVRLSWTPKPEADEYQVVVLGADLHEIARLGGIHESEFVLTGDALQGLPASGEVQVEIRALQRGDAISISKTRSVRLR